MRAKQDRAADSVRRTGVTILYTADAGFRGKECTQETSTWASLPLHHWRTLHCLVNNQIGFTTGPEEAGARGIRGDVAQDAAPFPHLHAIGEDPERWYGPCRIANGFPHEFQRTCSYDPALLPRRFGHNEPDEPAFHAAMLYKADFPRAAQRPARLYLRWLVEQKRVDKEQARHRRAAGGN